MLQTKAAAGVLTGTTSDPWSQRVGPLEVLPELIRQLGGDPDAVIAAAGIASNALACPENRIPYQALGPLLDEAAGATGCPHLGLLAGRACHLASLGVVGEIVANSPTVGEALRTLCQVQRLNADGGAAFLLERSGVVDLGYSVYHGGARGVDQVYDLAMAGGFNIVRELCGSSWLPTAVFLAHAAPADTRHYRSLFRVTPGFDAEMSAIRFPAHWMQRPIAGADPVRRLAAEARARLAPSMPLQPQVSRVLRIQLLHVTCSGDEVARALSMHRRTLNRHLKAEGTTYQQILDQVRFEVACQLLVNSRISLDDVAATLGYAGVSPFMRTFRRWSGTTPAHWRRTAGATQHPCAAGQEALA